MTTPNMKFWVAYGLLFAAPMVGCSKGVGDHDEFDGGALPGASDEDEDDDDQADDDDGSGTPTTTTGPAPGGSGDGPPPGDEPPAGGGDCCSGNGTPGCDDDGIEACVCDRDPFCCDAGWDDRCAGLVQMIGCGVCEDPPGPGGVGTTGADGGSTGGDDPGSLTSGPEPGTTGGLEPEVGTTGGDTPPPMTAACCDPLEVPGCSDPVLEQCICDDDPFCCDTAWDSLCVLEVDDFGCGTCAQ